MLLGLASRLALARGSRHSQRGCGDRHRRVRGLSPSCGMTVPPLVWWPRRRARWRRWTSPFGPRCRRWARCSRRWRPGD